MTGRLALLALPVIGVVLAAATVLPRWQAELAAQLREQHGCEVASFNIARIAVVNGKEAAAAQVRCKDGRVFEATRSGAGNPFAITQCGAGGC